VKLRFGDLTVWDGQNIVGGDRQPGTSPIATFRSIIAGRGADSATVEGRFAVSPLEVEMLCLLAESGIGLMNEEGVGLDVTLAYAFPVSQDPSWSRWATSHAALVSAAGQLVLVPTSDFSLVDTCDEAAELTRRRYRRLLRRHDQTQWSSCDLSEALVAWGRFCGERFGDGGPPQPLDVLETIFRATGCEARRISTPYGRALCYSVVNWNASSRTLFDVLCPWSLDAAKWRPGIYSALKNLLAAADAEWRFSMCYGAHPYKDALLADFYSPEPSATSGSLGRY